MKLTLKEIISVAGSQAFVAENCGVCQKAVWKWAKANRLPQTELLTGGPNKTEYAGVISKLANKNGFYDIYGYNCTKTLLLSIGY